MQRLAPTYSSLFPEARVRGKFLLLSGGILIGLYTCYSSHLSQKAVSSEQLSKRGYHPLFAADEGRCRGHQGAGARSHMETGAHARSS